MTDVWKTVRVFISSTFRDMHAEHDYLARFVFPRLRDELAKWRVHHVDVDLRWGVTAEQNALDQCMDEIERCRPRFVCLVGGGYGWVPPPKVIPAELMARIASEGDAVVTLSEEERTAVRELYVLGQAGLAYALRQKPRTASEAGRWQTRGDASVQAFRRVGVLGA